MAQYYAVSAIGETDWYDRSGQRCYGKDWYIVTGPCPTPHEAWTQGKEKIGPIFGENQTKNPYAETAHKNMEVTSKSKLKAIYRLDLNAIQEEAYVSDL